MDKPLICEYKSMQPEAIFTANKTRGQRHLVKAAPNDPVHTARGVYCTRRQRFKPRDRQTDRQIPRTLVIIVSISCVRASPVNLVNLNQHCVALLFVPVIL